jgi:hypothetical protein
MSGEAVAAGEGEATAGEPGVWPAFVAALTEPDALFRRIRGVEGAASPVGFAVGLGLMLGLVTSAAAWLLALHLLATRRGGGSGEFGIFGLFLYPLKAILIDPVYMALAALLGSVVVHGVSVFSGGRGGWTSSLRISAYALAPVALLSAARVVFAFLPLLRQVVVLVPYAQAGWWAFVVSQGVATLHGGRRRTALALAGIAAFVLLLVASRGHPFAAIAHLLVARGRR